MELQYIIGQWWFWPLVVWSLAWKGLALWRAVKNNSKGWFVALLIVNTFGVLDIIYVFVFGKKKEGL